MNIIENNKDRNGTPLQPGDRVRHAFRHTYDKYGETSKPDPDYVGTVLECEGGCNGGIIVQVDGRPFTSHFCHTDLVKIQ